MADKPGYLDGRRRYNDEMHRRIVEAASWRMIAFLMFGLSASLVVALVAQADRHIVRVAFAEIDGTTGQLLRVQALPDQPELKRIWIRRSLEDFVVKARTVTSDSKVLRRNLAAVFAQTTAPVEAFLDAWYSDPMNDPSLRVKNGRVTPEIKISNWVDGDTLRIRWKEKQWSSSGKPIGEEHWEALLSYTVLPPRSARAAYLNVMGIYLTELDWNAVRE